MKIFRHVLLFIVSLIQTLIGCFLISLFAEGDFENTSALLGALVIIVPLAAASLALRGEWEMGLMLGIAEFFAFPLCPRTLYRRYDCIYRIALGVQYHL